MRKFLAPVAAAMVAMTAGGAGVATAAHAYPSGVGFGWYHWTKGGTQQIRYALTFLDGAGSTADRRWLINGAADTGLPFSPFHPGESIAEPINGWLFREATNPADCSSPNANICVNEVNDPNLTCAGVTPAGGCATFLGVDGLSHIWYVHIDLNWNLYQGATRVQRQALYLHEVGHAIGLNHRTPNGTCYSFMLPNACAGIIDAHDQDMVNSLYNTHTDWYTWGYSKTGAPTKGKMTYATKGLVAKAKRTSHGLVKTIKAKSPRIVTEFPNGVYKVVKGGKTYWLGNKRLTLPMMNWYVRQGILNKRVVAN